MVSCRGSPGRAGDVGHRLVRRDARRGHPRHWMRSYSDPVRVNNSLPTRRPSVGYVPAHDGPGAKKGAPAGRADPGTALVPGRALTPVHQRARAGPEVADRGHPVPDLRRARRSRRRTSSGGWMPRGSGSRGRDQDGGAESGATQGRRCGPASRLPGRPCTRPRSRPFHARSIVASGAATGKVSRPHRRAASPSVARNCFS